MKSVLLKTLLSMSIGISLFASESLGSTSAFKDYIENEKDHIFSVVAETPNQTMLFWYARGFFGIGYSDKDKVFEDACLNMGGAITDKKKGEAFSMKCSAPNQQGFSVQRVSNGNHGDLHYLVKHEAPQAGGYAMKGYIRINELDKKPLADVLTAGEASSNFFNAYGYCLANHGKYVINNNETDKKPVSAETYLEGRMSRVLHSLYTQGNHWCVVPGEEGKALFKLNATYSSTGYPILKKVYIVDVPALDTLVSYNNMVARKKLQESAQNSDGQPQSDTIEQLKMQIAMSKKPSAAENELIGKVFKSKDTLLSRQGNNILEGIYLGENDQGCQLAALTKSSGQQYTHNHLTLSANAPEWIMNFKQCQGKPTEYLGESFEKTFPSDYKVEMEFRRVVDMCKVRGVGMGSYLGYNMDCKRMGSVAKPVYEVTMTKKEKLVTRSYEE